SHGFKAAILHELPGFRAPDMPASAPVVNAPLLQVLKQGDIVVIPEGAPPPMLNAIKSLPIRRIMIVLNWQYAYQSLGDRMDWRTFNVERIITHSPHIADFIGWAMRLEGHVFVWGIDEKLYYPAMDEKQPHIVYIKRKQGEIPELMRA